MAKFLMDHDEAIGRVCNPFIERIAEWVRDVAREDKRMFGCTVAMPCGIAKIAVSADWPESGSCRMVLADGRKFSLKLDRRRGRWFSVQA